MAQAGGQWPPDEREHYEQTLATLSDRMAPDALSDARAAGAVLSLDDAVSYALT